MNILNYYAYSKINLGLQVLNLREDGYHNINTVFYLINLFDEINFSKSDKIEIEIIPEMNIPLRENLIYKAGMEFFKFYNIKGGFKAVLKKKIPSGAGLGGGSSDAAVTITALNRMYDTSGNYQNLHTIAAKVGSDCTFFISGVRAAQASGRGEHLKYLHKQLKSQIVIVNPGIHISTPKAYKMLERNSHSHEEIDFGAIFEKYNSEPVKFRDLIKNDFEDVIFKQYPEIEKIKEKLYLLGADFALMSGSGSSVFGLFKNDIEYEYLKQEFPNYFCHISE